MIKNASDNENELAFIRKLYPDLNEEELREAENNFKEYADVVIGIYARIAREKMEQDNNSMFNFDSSSPMDTMKGT